MFKKVFGLYLLLCFLSAAIAQVSPKRGMAYGYHSVNDINTVSTGISWWYNWSDVPDPAIINYYQSIGVEFVPMVWNGSFNPTTVINNIKPDAKYLLAFNEPNFNGQANLTPQQAVNLWPQIEQIAAAKNLEIVSACPAYCGGSACVSGYTDPTVWHDQFFSLCPTCKVDYIAFHVYESTTGGAIALTNNLKKYGRPVWVTEFAWWDPSVSNASKVPYLQTVVNSFENDPDVYRYSWFAGRSSANSTVNILGSDGVLTTLGDAYIHATYPIINVPGKVEAENNYRRRATDTQTTSDVGGGLNVGWTDAGTWNEYLVNVSNTGSYKFNFRVASGVATGSFDILVDDVVVKSGVTVANTGGWQSWTDMPITGIVLNAGQRLIKIKYTGTGTNLNYINIVFESTVPPAADFIASPLNTCVGNKIVFTDQTTNKTGAETYVWNFGNDATPATATTSGPHTVTYSTAGLKTASLTVTNNVGPNTKTRTNYISIATPPATCLFSDEFNDNLVQWITPIPGAFTHVESASTWVVSNSGYGEWETFNYNLNNGTTASTLDFSCAANKPIVKIKAKASSNALLRITMVDGNGRTIDNINNYNLELTTNYQTFSIDFSETFRNYYGVSPGMLDSSNITALQFSVNPAYFSFPYTGTNGTYNYAFPGTVSIDWMGIGSNCNSSILPVELSNLKATEKDNGVEVSWTTLQENDSQYFIIERSTDAVNFYETGKVKSKGNSRGPVQYSFTDFSGLSSINYYRLKLVDQDGSVVLSEVVTVMTSKQSSIAIYPNPSNGESFIIKGTALNGLAIIEVWDMLGKRIFEKEMKCATEVITSDEIKLEKGIYFVKLNNSVVVQKLIIN